MPDWFFVWMPVLVILFCGACFLIVVYAITR